MDVINKGIDEKLFNYISKTVEKTPFYNLLGVYLQALGPGEADICVVSDEKHTNPMGLLHGGLIMSIADAAMGNAIRSLEIKGVTVDYSVSFLSTASLGELIQAQGRVVKSGRNIIFAKSTVYAGDKLIADIKATFFNTGKLEY